MVCGKSGGREKTRGITRRSTRAADRAFSRSKGFWPPPGYLGCSAGVSRRAVCLQQSGSHMDSLLSARLQDAIAASITRGVHVEWNRIVVNIEIDTIDGEQTENCLALSFKSSSNTWTRTSFRLPFECYDQFVGLRNSMDGTSNSPWKSCTFEVDPGGKYKFAFSYDSPRRLNGLHDDIAMLKNYQPQQL